MRALGMTDGFFTELLIANYKVVRFLLDSKNCLLLSGHGEIRQYANLSKRFFRNEVRV